MSQKGIVYLVAVVFLVLFVGLWGASASMGGKSYEQPKLEKAKGEKCIEDVEWMRANHMQLLDDWRDWALRDGKRVYINHAGEEHIISLQNSCMKCHTNMDKFCGECHTNAGVSPYCWDCHIKPEGYNAQ